MDVEDGEVKGFEFNDQSIRRGFIRKVYSILMCQLLVTFGFICLFVFHEPTKRWFMANSYMMFVALAVTFVTMIVMACCENVRRTTPTNFIFLAIFTIAESFLLGAVATTSAPEAVMMAVGVTAAVSLALTLFAFQTKWDFTMMGGALVCATVILLILGICFIFIRNNILHLIYGCIGALIFCLYLVYDTQLMVGDKYKYNMSPEEYIFATQNLFLDIVDVCLCICSIFIRNQILHLVYGCIGALIFCLYLVYDTQLMMGGKHKYSISPEEYIFAALNLYLDIVNIFLYILMIINAASR